MKWLPDNTLNPDNELILISPRYDPYPWLPTLPTNNGALKIFYEMGKAPILKHNHFSKLPAVPQQYQFKIQTIQSAPANTTPGTPPKTVGSYLCTVWHTIT